MSQSGKTRVQFEFDAMTMNRLKKLKHKTEASSYAAVVRNLLRDAAEPAKQGSDEIERLRKLAYMGEHHFPENTWKYRCDELIAERDKREARRQLPDQTPYEGKSLVISGHQLQSLWFEKMSNHGATALPWQYLKPGSVRAWNELASEIVLRIP